MNIDQDFQDYRLKGVVLPKRIYIRVAAPAATKEKDYQYLSRSTTGLEFKKGLPDEHCVWIVGERKEFGENIVALKGKMGTAYIGTYSCVKFGITRHYLLCTEGLEGTQASCELKIIFTADRKFVHISLATLEGFFMFPKNLKVMLTTKSRIRPRIIDTVPLRYAEASERCKFEIIEPSISQEIHDIVYSVPTPNLSLAASAGRGWSVTQCPPLIAFETVVHNSDRHADSKEILTYSYQKMESGTWSDKLGMLYGWKVNFKTTVPHLASTFELSGAVQTEHEWGETNGKTVTVTSSTEITVKPGQQTRARVIVYRSMLNVEFTYKQTVIYNDGTKETYDRIGIYNNLESYNVFIEVSPASKGNSMWAMWVQPKTPRRRVRLLRLLKKLGFKVK